MEVLCIIKNLKNIVLQDSAIEDGVNIVVALDIEATEGHAGGVWTLNLNPEFALEEGVADGAPVTMKVNADDFIAIATGQMETMGAFMQGKIKVEGDMPTLMNLQKYLDLAKAAPEEGAVAADEGKPAADIPDAEQAEGPPAAAAEDEPKPAADIPDAEQSGITSTVEGPPAPIEEAEVVPEIEAAADGVEVPIEKPADAKIEDQNAVDTNAGADGAAAVEEAAVAAEGAVEEAPAVAEVKDGQAETVVPAEG